MSIAEYVFYPVGQGLFASGILKTGGNNSLIWVYDCGSLEKEADNVLSPQIADFQSTLNNMSIDLLALSHFHEDHKNGIVQLLEKCNVDTILLPYLNRIEKNLYIYSLVEQAVSNDIDIDEAIDDDTILFIRNPNFYLSRDYHDKIKNILLVFPNDHPASNTDNSLSHENGNERESHQKLKWQTTKWDDPYYKGDIPTLYLTPGTSIKYKTFWEFLPYNDTQYNEKMTELCKDDSFCHKFDLSINSLVTNLKVGDKNAKENALAKITKDYDSVFKKGNRNAISLFLYAGMVSPVHHVSLGSNVKDITIEKAHKHGILYTGDGYLKNIDQLERLVQAIGFHRLENISCLQVMHHGSYKNCHRFVPKILSPDISIFSANPLNKNYHHPSGQTVLNFVKYHPLLVEEKLVFQYFFDWWYNM